MALIDNLISYWKLDEASGNALDAHGTNDLTDHATVGSAVGKINNARDFEADNLEETLFCAANSDLDTGDIDFTFAVWVQLESKTVQRGVLHKGNLAGGQEYVLRYGSGSDRFICLINSVPLNATNFGSPSVGVWYHIVFWHDSVGNEIGISVNAGTPNTAPHTTGTGTPGTDNFGIGMAFVLGVFYNDPWDGLIDELGFWKRVLTSQERTDLYNAGNGFAYPFIPPPATLDQEGYRWRNDDGSESAATWKVAQDTDFTGPIATNTRLRTLVNATLDPATQRVKVQYRKVGQTEEAAWRDVTYRP